MYIFIYTYIDLPDLFSPHPVSQSVAYDKVLQTLYTFDWHKFVRRKMSEVFCHSRMRLSDGDIDRTFECIRRVGGFPAMCWIKAISNSWTTYFRMHEHHLLSCLWMWALGARSFVPYHRVSHAWGCYFRCSRRY